MGRKKWKQVGRTVLHEGEDIGRSWLVEAIMGDLIDGAIKCCEARPSRHGELETFFTFDTDYEVIVRKKIIDEKCDKCEGSGLVRSWCGCYLHECPKCNGTGKD